MNKFPYFLNVLFLIGIMTFLAIPLQSSKADIGPKETASFEFVPDTGMPPLSIIEGTLLICKDKDCQSASSLNKAGPQHFTCQANQCTSMAYGYGEYMRLSIHFSDGVTRQSNIFGKQYFSANYRVTVRQQDLTVDEMMGGSYPESLWQDFVFIVGRFR